MTSPGGETAETVGTVLVRLSPVLTRLFPDAEPLVRLRARSVDEMVDALEARWPGMRDRICDSTPAIRRHMNVFVDGERAVLATRLADGADVYVLTAVSGG